MVVPSPADNVKVVGVNKWSVGFDGFGGNGVIGAFVVFDAFGGILGYIAVSQLNSVGVE